MMVTGLRTLQDIDVRLAHVTGHPRLISVVQDGQVHRRRVAYVLSLL
jgi:hypothetical protein